MFESCQVEILGQVPYEQAWRYQERLSQAVACGERLPTLLLLEHPHTFTFGRRGQKENLLWDDQMLQKNNAEVHWVDRGGDVTYHGPGQLVGYPILPLTPPHKQSASAGSTSDNLQIPKADYIGYLRKLELVIIQALSSLGVQAHQLPELTGIWVYLSNQEKPLKIGAIGVKIDSRGITRHGFSLNINPDMRYWQAIIGCGLREYAATSLAELSQPTPNMEDVCQQVILAFGKVFNCQMNELRVKL